jgi:hypothetical protein
VFWIKKKKNRYTRRKQKHPVLVVSGCSGRVPFGVSASLLSHICLPLLWHYLNGTVQPFRLIYLYIHTYNAHEIYSTRARRSIRSEFIIYVHNIQITITFRIDTRTYIVHIIRVRVQFQWFDIRRQ